MIKYTNMTNILVYILRIILGAVWVSAAVVTAILLAPFQLFAMISTHIWRPQDVRY
jgi:hypothetical protein